MSTTSSFCACLASLAYPQASSSGVSTLAQRFTPPVGDGQAAEPGCALRRPSHGLTSSVRGQRHTIRGTSTPSWWHQGSPRPCSQRSHGVFSPRLPRHGASPLRVQSPFSPPEGALPHSIRTVSAQSMLHHFLDLPVDGPLRDSLFASVGALSAFSISALMALAYQWNDRKMKDAAEERGPASMPELPHAAAGLLAGLEMGVGGQKESVEWVNMVLHKIWKVYRRSLEAWLVGLLQPAIDSLALPSVVRRVEIAEFSLDYEPLSVRNVQRRASRRANDLQYHVGLRYTGDARCLLLLHLTVAGVDFAVPVGVHNLDVEAELWVKLRLTPRKPYVGTLSIAFVRLPTIKLVLAPFRIVNLFAIPFLSNFLSKLLTVDLPRLLVLPRHITFDFLPAGEDESHISSPSSMVLDLLKSETFTGLAGQEPMSPVRMEPSDAFVGELSVTLCEARNLPSLGLSVFSNPYCRLIVGESMVESKRNSETSHPAGARDPVWNQDFLFWVEDPVEQKLTVVVRDSMAPLNRNIGFVEVPIWQLQDCAPLSMWLPLLQDGPFGVKPAQGEVRLLLTYKSYVDHRDADGAGMGGPQSTSSSQMAYIKVFGSESDAEASEAEVDSDGERERELQRERKEKGLHRLGEEPGVEVVASNEGQLRETHLQDAETVLVSVPPSSSSSSSPYFSSSSRPVEREGVDRSGGLNELGEKAGQEQGLVAGLWNGTKTVSVGAYTLAGGLLAGTGGLLVGTGGVLWRAGGAVVSATGGAMAGAGNVAKTVAGKVGGVLFPSADVEYLYEDDDELEPGVSPVRVRSYRQLDSGSADSGRAGAESEGVEDELKPSPRYYGDEFYPAGDEGRSGGSEGGRNMSVGRAESECEGESRVGQGKSPLDELRRSEEMLEQRRSENMAKRAEWAARMDAEERRRAGLEEQRRQVWEERGVGRREAEGEREHEEVRASSRGSEEALRAEEGQRRASVEQKVASIEQKVARLVEWNLDGNLRDDLLQALVSTLRHDSQLDDTDQSSDESAIWEESMEPKDFQVRVRFDDGDMVEVSAPGSGQSRNMNCEEGTDLSKLLEGRDVEEVEDLRRVSLAAHEDGHVDLEAEPSRQGRDSWRALNGAISDLMDFFSR